MSPTEAQSRIKARIWQAIAQSDIDTSKIERKDLDSLVDLVTEAALMELDDEMGKSYKAEQSKPALFDGDEQPLWEGRPFLSLNLHYMITTERVRITEGLLGKAREDIELVRIQDMDHSQTFSERLLKIGDITIRSHDSSHPQVVLKNVRDPEAVHEILRRAVLDARKRYNFTYQEEM
ncbi:MAG: PH domain-containing protein [Anaerolineae bacterium]